MSDFARVNFSLIRDKIREFAGVCKALTCEESLSKKQIIFLAEWFDKNEEILKISKFGKIIELLNEILSDSKIDDKECERMLCMLKEFLLSEQNSDFEDEIRSNLLPLDKPTPEIIINGVNFFLAGDFKHIKFEILESIIAQKGGKVLNEVCDEVKFVVCGLGKRLSEAKFDITNSLKIATNLKSQGCDIKIISERELIERFS